jgi:hypothetical protein
LLLFGQNLKFTTLRAKFYTSSKIELTPCLPGERLDHYTEAEGSEGDIVYYRW